MKKVVTTCPHCGSKVKVGFVNDLEQVKNPTPPPTHEPGEEGPAPSGGGAAMGRSSAGPSPNDQRSNVMNPNNPASQAAANNRANQLNPNSPAYRSSRGRR